MGFRIRNRRKKSQSKPDHRCNRVKKWPINCGKPYTVCIPHADVHYIIHIISDDPTRSRFSFRKRPLRFNKRQYWRVGVQPSDRFGRTRRRIVSRVRLDINRVHVFLEWNRIRVNFANDCPSAACICSHLFLQKIRRTNFQREYFTLFEHRFYLVRFLFDVSRRAHAECCSNARFGIFRCT